MELISLYSTPIWISEFPDFDNHKETFIKAVKNFKQQYPETDKKFNNSGYQSPPIIQTQPELTPLFEYVCSMGFNALNDLNINECDLFLTSAWVNFNDSRECMSSEHIHEETLSGVFYLSAPENSGSLVFRNEAINRMWSGCRLTKSKNQFTGELTRIEPIEGNIIIFPSYLPHSVETNHHDDERISISFNLVAMPSGQVSPNQK